MRPRLERVGRLIDDHCHSAVQFAEVPLLRHDRDLGYPKGQGQGDDTGLDRCVPSKRLPRILIAEFSQMKTGSIP